MQNVIASATSTDTWGTNDSRSVPSPTVTTRSTRSEYTNVETKAPSMNWFVRSCMKFSGNRGPSWLDACVSTSSVSENATPATVIIDDAIVVSTARAPSLCIGAKAAASQRASQASPSRWPTDTVTPDSTTAATPSTAGTNQ